MISTPNGFKIALNKYLGITSVKGAQEWIDEQECNPSKKEDFMMIARLALISDISAYKEEASKDYIDACRRGYD